MFDELIRQLKKYEKGVSVPIKITVDDDGYFDRVCPNAECRRYFKVFFQDWKEKVADERVFCPICRHAAERTDWNSPEQKEYIEQQGLRHLKGVISKAMRNDARKFNSRQKPGFITMKMQVKPGSPPPVIPIEAADVMQQRYVCEQCGCRYASIGAAYFCPACGHNSAILDFHATLDTIHKTVEGMTVFKDSLAEQFDKDHAENAERWMLESSVGTLSAALQRVTEELFTILPNASIFSWDVNRFQRIDDASNLWRDATGQGYDTFLSYEELQELKKFIQRRHKIGHKQSMVDQNYITRSGDTAYQAGQRLVISRAQVKSLCNIIEKLVNGLRTLTRD